MRYGIVKGDKVLIDTSIWIEYFGNQNKFICTIKKFIEIELIA